MNETTTSAPIPTSFKVIGILAILWNIFGVFSFIGHTFFSEQAFEGMTDDQVAYMQSYPSWGYIVFAIAVFAGLL